MAKTRNYDAYYDDEDDNAEVPDGYGVKVHMMMMDGKPRRITEVVDMRNHLDDHRPHFATPTELEDFRRNTARQVMIDRAANAWRTTGHDQKPELEPDDPDDDPDDPDIDDQTRRKRARDAYIKRTTNAWRTPTRLVAGWGPNAAGPGPDFTGTGRPTPGENRDSRRLLTRDEATSMKNAAYAEYCNRVYNAWRGGR